MITFYSLDDYKVLSCFKFFRVIRAIKIQFYGKREFVPHDQVFPLIVVYCLLLLHKNK